MKLSSANVEIDGARLRRLRQIAGLSIANLAIKVGCSSPYISMLETKPHRTCSPEIFARICDALGLVDRRVLLRSETTEPDRSAA